MPVTFDARSTSAVEMTPAVALRKPVTFEKVKAFDATSREVDARSETVMSVYDALFIVNCPVNVSGLEVALAGNG